MAFEPSPSFPFVVARSTRGTPLGGPPPVRVPSPHMWRMQLGVPFFYWTANDAPILSGLRFFSQSFLAYMVFSGSPPGRCVRFLPTAQKMASDLFSVNTALSFPGLTFWKLLVSTPVLPRLSVCCFHRAWFPFPPCSRPVWRFLRPGVDLALFQQLTEDLSSSSLKAGSFSLCVDFPLPGCGGDHRRPPALPCLESTRLPVPLFTVWHAVSVRRNSVFFSPPSPCQGTCRGEPGRLLYPVVLLKIDPSFFFFPSKIFPFSLCLTKPRRPGNVAVPQLKLRFRCASVFLGRTLFLATKHLFFQFFLSDGFDPGKPFFSPLFQPRRIPRTKSQEGPCLPPPLPVNFLFQ